MGPRQLNVPICGVKAGQTCKLSAVAMDHSLLSSVVNTVLCAEQTTGNHDHSTVWLLPAAPTFLPGSKLSLHVSFAGLWVQRNWSGPPFMWSPKMWGKLSRHPALLFPARGTHASCGVPSKSWAMPAWEQENPDKNEAFLFPFVCSHSLGFFWFHYVIKVS